MDPLTTCLWFDTEGEEAANFYAEVFPNSSVGKVTPYATGDRAGQTMTVDFVINGSKWGWRGVHVRLAQGPIRSVMAGRSDAV